MSEDQRITTLAIFFNLSPKDHDSAFLSKLGFGSGILQHLKKN
jgi:hypothetical protein